MARESQDREDLLRDATAFHHRLQLRLACVEDATDFVAGFRSAGALSLYFDQDPVYHFNTVGELRRAFVAEALLKAEGGKLVELRRQTSATQTAMLRRTLSPKEKEQFCKDMSQRLAALLALLHQQRYEIVGAVPEDESEAIIKSLTAWLETNPPIAIAQAPHVNA